MDDADIVADASAVLALLQAEPFRNFDPERLVGAWISAVNYSEILAKLVSGGLTSDQADEAVGGLDLRIVPFDAVLARRTALLAGATRRAGLSLGDRACLCLGMHLAKPVVTGDRAWRTLRLEGVQVLLIR